MRYAPDQNNPLPKPGHGGDDNGQQHNGGKPFRVVMPSEIRSLASDMSGEFGGSAKGWRRNIRQPSQSVFNFGRGNGNGTGNGNGNPVPPGTGPNTLPGVEPTYPQNNRAPMMSPMSFEAPVTALPQAQQAQRQPLTPEMIDIIRAHMMRG